MKTRFFFFSLLFFLLIGAGCRTEKTTLSTIPEPQEPVTIGWTGPLTGDAASLGNDALQAAELAREEINAAGGINGHRLEFAVQDNQCDGKQASNAGTKLITIDNVPVIIGGLCSGETLAIAPIAEQHKTVLFSPCSSAPDVTNAGDFVFRGYPSDSSQGKFVADYVYQTLGKRTVALLVVQNPWGEGVKDTFIKHFQAMGGTVVANESFSQESRDMRAQLTKIKQSNAEILYFLGVTEASLVGLKQVNDLGLSLPIIGGDTWDDSKIHESPYAEGVIYTVPEVSVPDTFRSALKAKGADVTICVPGSYNNVKIVADIMQRVGIDPVKIKDELYNVKNFPGINGPITLDAKGDLESTTFSVKKVKGGKAEVTSD